MNTVRVTTSMLTGNKQKSKKQQHADLFIHMLKHEFLGLAIKLGCFESSIILANSDLKAIMALPEYPAWLVHVGLVIDTNTTKVKP